MTKAIDETWRVGNRVPRHIYRGDGPGDVVGTLDREEDARLAAAAPEMARWLVDLEFMWNDAIEAAECRSCGATRFDVSDHASDCAWLLLMRKAGVR